MNPFYSGFVPNLALHTDDLMGIRALYPLPPGMTTPPTSFPVRTTIATTTTIEPPPDPCQVTKWDGFTTTRDGSTYLFTGNYYFTYSENQTFPRTPRLIKDDWKYVPGNIEGIFTFKNGHTMIFKEYWFDWFIDKERVDQFIRYSFLYFPDLPYWNMNSIWQWGDYIYATDDKEYFRFRGHYTKRTFSDWWNAPLELDTPDAAGWHKNELHFFKGRKAYVLNEADNRVQFKGYVGEIFFKCPPETQKLQSHNLQYASFNRIHVTEFEERSRIGPRPQLLNKKVSKYSGPGKISAVLGRPKQTTATLPHP